MTIEEFAQAAGVQIIRCRADWGGPFGYKTKDAPNVSINGFASKDDAYQGWLEDTFGKFTAKAVRRLLKSKRRVVGMI